MIRRQPEHTQPQNPPAPLGRGALQPLGKFFLSMRSQLAMAFVFSRIAGYVFFLLMLPGLTVKNHRQYMEGIRLDTLSQQVEEHYEAHQTLQGLRLVEHASVVTDLPQVPDPQATLGLLDARGTLLTPLPGQSVGGTISPEAVLHTRLLKVDGQVIGSLIQLKPLSSSGYTTDEKALLDSVYETVKVTLPMGLVVALVGAVVIAYFLTLPLQRLTRAAQAVMRKEKVQQVPVTLQNEVGDLTRAFNEMLNNLAQGEQQRRQMIADIAHDLGTPLTVASGYVQGMKQGRFLASPERLGVVHEELLLMQNLVDDLRLLSLADAGTLKLSMDPMPPSRLVKTIQQSFALRAEKAGIGLHAACEADLPEVNIDLERMRQVLGNLVSNSLNHTPRGGQIQVKASSTPDHVLLEVEDTGKGIPAEKLPYIFERFFRVDESRNHDEAGGSGLGLAIARSIVELHGGSITAFSREGSGTTVRVLLPRL